MKQHVRGFSLPEIGFPLLTIVLLFLAGCLPAVTPPPTPIVVTATPEPTEAADLAATIAALATELAGKGNPPDPPVVDPPVVEPPAPEPPAPDLPTATPTTEPPAPVPPPPDPPTATPTIAIPHGIVSAPVSVNVRTGPDTEYPIARVSARGSRLEVVGRSLDGEWWHVRVADIAGGVGWVSTIYLETQNTANVPVVQAPPLPPTITPSPTATRTPAPVSPPTSSLDWRASPYYGSHDIFPTFDSQTVSYSVTGGGEINTRNAGLPGSCTGYVSSAPDVEIDLQGSTDLYIYFLSGSDATLIINDPYGNWYCDDDSYGNGNPMVVFRGAGTGVYDIWVGRYGSSGLTQPGTLYIGEMHP